MMEQKQYSILRYPSIQFKTLTPEKCNAKTLHSHQRPKNPLNEQDLVLLFHPKKGEECYAKHTTQPTLYPHPL